LLSMIRTRARPGLRRSKQARLGWPAPHIANGLDKPVRSQNPAKSSAQRPA
jgi:hypothetical protein